MSASSSACIAPIIQVLKSKPISLSYLSISSSWVRSDRNILYYSSNAKYMLSLHLKYLNEVNEVYSMGHSQVILYSSWLHTVDIWRMCQKIFQYSVKYLISSWYSVITSFYNINKPQLLSAQILFDYPSVDWRTWLKQQSDQDCWHVVCHCYITHFLCSSLCAYVLFCIPCKVSLIDL